ncbi:neutral zinc metallopeptidase [Planctomyces sp. SH-PL62]|uniref:KPN_02809 family neutral zinc metallopeptidase n=1 Tax=Planctomyces sp. SH-PL62 TaxID=1636152 RepID=UPI00078CE00C|nr:neutral zinc metallopeptidase [Planctomyces sp. SH-PL62]AMV36464.1 Putative neutral zinc metallopeptidase [Planctomyces sp. SH-PL62]
MRWQGGRESENVEDRRGVSPAAVGGGIGTLIVIVLALFLGIDPRPLLRVFQGGAPGGAPQQQQRERELTPQEKEQGQFVRALMAMTEDVWNEQFAEMGREYQEPTLVLFSGQVATQGCGFASSAVGPFYCPGDQKVYIDLSFYDELKTRFKAPGEFAQAYVIAHEVGHHVQNLLGISEKISRAQQQSGKAEANRLSVMLELQADFFAGVWAHHIEKKRHVLESGDIESGLRAATAIGDDALQKQAQGYTVPDSFTHGTSEQRVRWFTKGLQTGDVNQGDTFNAPDL